MVYFANSSEDTLSEQCADCPLGYGWNDPNQGQLFENEQVPKSCPVALIQLEFNYKQCGIPHLRNAMKMLVDDSGVCKVRALIVECRDAARWP